MKPETTLALQVVNELQRSIMGFKSSLKRQPLALFQDLQRCEIQNLLVWRGPNWWEFGLTEALSFGLNHIRVDSSDGGQQVMWF